MTEPKFKIEGSKGKLIVYDDRVFISIKKTSGWVNRLEEETIYFHNIISLEFVDLTFTGGVLNFIVQGNARVLFGFPKSAKDNAKEVKSYIESRINEARWPVAQPVNQASQADELRKFKQLMDDGIISPTEFDQKKQQLLNDKTSQSIANPNPITAEGKAHSANSKLSPDIRQGKKSGASAKSHTTDGISTSALVLIGVVGICTVVALFKSTESEKEVSPGSLQPTQLIDPNKSYKQFRQEIISSGWTVYKRVNELKGWTNKLYPELDFCDEDVCTASFINAEKSQVRTILFGICSTDRYYQCPDKQKGFERVERDTISSKDESDAEFLSFKKRFEN